MIKFKSFCDECRSFMVGYDPYNIYRYIEDKYYLIYRDRELDYLDYKSLRKTFRKADRDYRCHIRDLESRGDLGKAQGLALLVLLNDKKYELKYDEVYKLEFDKGYKVKLMKVEFGNEFCEIRKR